MQCILKGTSLDVTANVNAADAYYPLIYDSRWDNPRILRRRSPDCNRRLLRVSVEVVQRGPNCLREDNLLQKQVTLKHQQTLGFRFVTKATKNKSQFNGNVNLYIRQAEFDTQIPEFDTQI